MNPERTLARAVRMRPLPLGEIGFFGDDLPAAMLQAHGLRGGDVALAAEAPKPHPEVTRVTEPFMDARSIEFLHRLAHSAFDDLAGIVFCRDDGAALPAYQYATELRRTGALRGGPDFFLWNLLHGTTPPVTNFNTAQATKLNDWLAVRAGRTPACDLGEQGRAMKALAEAQAEALVSGESAMTCRLAARWMDPGTHTAALAAVLAGTGAPREGLRIALLGAACDQPQVYAAIERAGTVVCDLTQFGGHAPRLTGDAQADLAAIAADPLHPRGAPADRFRPAILKAVADARCDVVVVQLDETDHSFGWDVPSLHNALAGLGVPVVHLGFRPLRPDEAWCDRAASLLQGEPA